ncbi:MAG TPA: hypothetical protein VJP79_01470, partial [Nitrososphaera sp.]|nr:hypothetical protein [Nitrososphaera sp.]
MPGETVRVTIELPALSQASGDRISYAAALTLIEGIIDQHTIMQLTKPIKQNPTYIEFELPERDPTNSNYHYVIKTRVYDDDLKEYGWSVIALSTIAGGDKVGISDLKVDNEKVNPGESLDVSYAVKDGTGALVPWGYTGIGLCDSKLQEPIPGNLAITPSIIARENQSSASFYGCHFLYSGIASPTGIFNIKLRVPADLSPGHYFLNAWTEAFPFPDSAAAWTNVAVSDKQRPAGDDQIIAHSVWMTNNTNSANRFYPPISPDNPFVTPGEELGFYGFQFGNLGGADILGEKPELPYWLDESSLAHRPAVSNVNVNIKIVAPSGAAVFDKNVLTNSDGSFPKITFPITQDLEDGLYLVYYNATMPDGTYVHYVGDDSDNVDWFYVSRIQKFTVETEGRAYDVILQGVGINASHFVFDRESRTISLDIQRINATYGNRQFFNSLISADCPILYIEDPLLTGRFSITFNDQPNAGCGATWYGSSGNAGKLMVGPINKSGKLRIQGTYGLPAFSFIPVTTRTIANNTIVSQITGVTDTMRLIPTPVLDWS